jgi:small subunit ribosomal protein S3
VGQKARPIVMRLGINRSWDSGWFAEGKKYADYLHEDIAVRKVIEADFKKASVSKVYIERPAKRLNVSIHTSRPGFIIGKKGADIERLRSKLIGMTGRNDIQINIVEVKKPEVNAKLIADSVAQQLEKRVSYRKAMKRVMQSAQRYGAKGIRINVAGRLGGAEIARTEWYREGRVPLHTLRADIDYGTAEAKTTYGIIGVKVWVYNGDNVK